ncbi:hypothetical protein HDZ31DRAFT_61736 [Schizophyllum fasciatum]
MSLSSAMTSLASSRRVAVALVTAAIVFLLPLSVWRTSPADVSQAPAAAAGSGKVVAHPWDTRRYIRPKIEATSFRDRLRSDVKYLAQWGGPVGFSNQIISQIHVLYLALLSERVPIIPPFIANGHVGYDEPVLSFGEVFDLDFLRAQLRAPVLEWSDVQARDGATDTLGCWALANWHGPAQTPMDFSHALGVDVVYTPVPHDARSDYMYATDHVAELVHPGSGLAELYRQSSEAPEALRPDDHLACFDFTYFVSSAADLNLDHSAGAFWPAWWMAGQHVRFTRAVRERAQGQLRRAFALQAEAAVPAYISVHIRRGDFVDICGDVPTNECFAPLSAYVRRVQEVQENLQARDGVAIERVIVSSNEHAPSFWAEVDRLGWAHIDYGTGDTNGGWWGIILDTCIQAMSDGFVGTWGSTVSELSQRRVESWNSGPTRMVRWGKPGADDH